ncbi:hypothetical protein INR49_020728 [Caranx melampygus]|nr:hypothetical protein INR49_020728 [Caranx melampygus]
MIFRTEPAEPAGGVMTSQILLDTLEHLRNDEFQKFKWLLQQGGNSEQQPPIPAGRLEGAEPWRTVDLMEQTFTAPEALQVTRTILRRMSRNDLVHLLSEAESGPEDARELRVDSNTVNRYLGLSDSGRTVTLVAEEQPYPNPPPASMSATSCCVTLGSLDAATGRWSGAVWSSLL